MICCSSYISKELMHFPSRENDTGTNKMPPKTQIGKSERDVRLTNKKSSIIYPLLRQYSNYKLIIKHAAFCLATKSR